MNASVQAWLLRRGIAGECVQNVIAPIALGIVACVAVVGLAPLDVTNVAWLARIDDVQHYLGWAFFRHSPWSLPLGANPDFGLEIGSSIFYSDSIAALAIPFKAVAPLLPQPFQYFGLWFLLCFVLQAVLAFRLVGLATPHAEARLLGAGLFVFAPPMLRRIGGPYGGHHALVGHWLLLAALWLCLDLQIRRRSLLWTGLAALTAWVHAYLLAMVLALWLADLARRAIESEGESARGAIQIGGEIVAVLGATVVALWQAGFFLVHSGFAELGFGVYRMNLLAPFDPMGWSRLLPDLPSSRGEFGGFSYYGLGALVLLALAGIAAFIRLAWVAVRAPRSLVPARRWIPLTAVCVACTLFALSNRIAVGTWVWTIPLPQWAENVAGILRASGRLFWPVYYLLLWLGLRSFVSTYGGWADARQESRRSAGRITVAFALAALLALQVWDISAGWEPVRTEHAVTGSSYPTLMQSDFWRVAAVQYKKVRIVPTANHDRRWRPVALYAMEHGLATDAVFLARLDTEKLAALNLSVHTQLETGHFDADTLYLVDRDAALLAVRSMDPASDLLARVDRFAVLAPRWRRCEPCRAASANPAAGIEIIR